MAVAWYTIDEEVGSVVRLARSRDHGETLDPPLTIDDAQPLGRVDVAILEDASTLVCWLAHAERDAELIVRRVSADGTIGPRIVIATVDSSRASGFPTMDAFGSGAVVAWTEVGTTKRVRTARLELVRD